MEFYFFPNNFMKNYKWRIKANANYKKYQKIKM